MENLTDLIWSVEEDEHAVPDTPPTLKINCSGGCCGSIACCCSVPEIVTKWLCN